MIYTVTMNPSLDYVIAMDSFQPGKLNRADAVSLIPGGKGINVSLMLRHLGHESVALGFAAGFTGEEIKRHLWEEKIRTEFIELKEGNSRINVKIKAEQETELNAAGPSVTQEETSALIEKLAALRMGDYLVLAGSIPKTIPETIYESILESLAGRGIRIVVDAEGELLLRTLKYHPFLVKPNKAELSELYGRKLSGREEIAEAAVWLKKQGAENVLVSLAGEGAILSDANGMIYDRKAARGKVINSVGAGDSMVAGFLAGYEERGEYGYALRLGMSAGSASAFSSGIATEEQVKACMEEWYAEI